MANIGAKAQAGPATLAGERLRQAVSGKTIYIATPLGVELPIHYHTNGRMTGRGLVQFASVAAEMARNDTGRWWIAGARLCQRWRRWLGGTTHCFMLWRRGRTVLWRRNDGRTGTARIAG